MTMLHTSIQKRGKSEKDYILQNHHTNADVQSFLQENESGSSKNLSIQIDALKRISPFLIAEVCLPVLSMYLIFKDPAHTVMLLFLFLFTEINAMLIDFVLWNYHRGNKIWRIWSIELTAIVFSLYFFL